MTPAEAEATAALEPADCFSHDIQGPDLFLPMNAGYGASIYRLLNGLFRCTVWRVHFRQIIGIHPEYFGRYFHTKSAADTGILVHIGCFGHDHSP